MSDRDDLIERAIATLREPVAVDTDLERRVLAEIARLPQPRPAGPLRLVGAWLVRARPVRISPVAALAAAAALAIAVLGTRTLMTGGPSAPLGSVAQLPPAAVQFVVVAPGASFVSLVGDFNDWSTDATPMRPQAEGQLWEVTLPLTPGRYRYAFLVDGTTWVADPAAPRALEDDFGRPNSVVTIGGT